MSYSREDYDALIEKNKKSLNGERPNLEYLTQAAVKQVLLTGNPHWDTFLSYLQSALERMLDQEIQLRDRLCSSSLVSPDGIMETKLALAEIVGQIKTIEAVIGLPKDIMETGEKAKDRLKDLG